MSNAPHADRLYRVEYDPHPDLSYLDQPEFAEVDKDSIVSYMVTVLAHCGHCGSWDVDTDADLPHLGGIDVEIGSEDDIGIGTYKLHELPEFIQENYK